MVQMHYSFLEYQGKRRKGGRGRGVVYKGIPTAPFRRPSVFPHCWSQSTKGTFGCIVSDILTENQIEKMSLPMTSSVQPPQEIVPNQVWTFVLGPSSGPRQMVIMPED